MATNFTCLIYLIITTSSIYVVLSSPTLVLNLIHPNQLRSIDPPHVSRNEEASVARQDYLQSKATGDIIARLSPNVRTAFLVNISIGSPPIIQLLHMDTGSQFMWLQCRPCTNCYSQNHPIFDPARSYTYYHKKTCRVDESCGVEESCKASEDHMPILNFNSKTKSCEYSMKYMDGTGSRGTLAKDTLAFNTIYDEFQSVSKANVVFGCGHDNYGEPQQGTGVLGLGYGEFSLVQQFDSIFSYCFGSIYDLSYAHNVLVIGDGADIMGDTTPLEIKNQKYYVQIEAISVDGTLLPIDQWVFQRDEHTGSGGTIIDTGTTLTFLVREAYEQLKGKIEDVFDGRFETTHVHQPVKTKIECYNGDFERDLVESGFPIITFHFSDGAELSLDVKSVFVEVASGVFCLAIAPSIDDDDLSIIGTLAQQNYNIGYDIKARKVSFERIDCAVLFNY